MLLEVLMQFIPKVGQAQELFFKTFFTFYQMGKYYALVEKLLI